MDRVSVKSLTLTTSALARAYDSWQRPAPRLQPLVVSVTVETDVRDEGSTDSLRLDGLNYGQLANALAEHCAEHTTTTGKDDGDKITSALIDDTGLEAQIDDVAQSLARLCLAHARSASAVTVDLRLPKALLGADALGLRIRRTRSQHAAHDDDDDDELYVQRLRRDIVIGLNAPERLEPQPVTLDYSFFTSPDDRLEVKNKMRATRAPWAAWRETVHVLDAHLAKMKPLTIEAAVCTMADICLTPRPSARTTTTATTTPSWRLSRCTIELSKPNALTFARSPSVKVTRHHHHHAPSSRALFSSGRDVAEEGWHTVYLALGSNMGVRTLNLSRALDLLESHPHSDDGNSDSGAGGEKQRRRRQREDIKVQATSFLYESAPMYVREQATFLNAAARLSTRLSPRALLARCKDVERTLGRDAPTGENRNGPRPVDLDILLFDDLELDTRTTTSGGGGGGGDEEDRWLRIPHERMLERGFVLLPLADVLLPSHRAHLPGFSAPRVSVRSALQALRRTGALKAEDVHQVYPLSMARDVVARRAHAGRPVLMSIVNCTPDSFSDGGAHFALEHAVQGALRYVDQGAHVVDIGGMSTRPGAADVTAEEEERRVVPVIKALRERGLNVPISIDTFRPSVAKAAVAAGADMINDVLGARSREMRTTMRELGVPVILMHSRGMPETMSALARYDGGYDHDDDDDAQGATARTGVAGTAAEVVDGVWRELARRVRDAEAPDDDAGGGIRKWNVIVDPGLGFAKVGQKQNGAILSHLARLRLGGGGGTASSDDDEAREERELHGLAKYPLLIGPSRKRFLAEAIGDEQAPVVAAKDRDWATAAAVSAAVAGGADVVRVHNVDKMRDVLLAASAIFYP